MITKESEKKFKAGFVAVLGRPNTGKSTLMNALVGEKVSIISPIPQTTRHQIRGILNLEGAQIVFVDTPGMHSFKDHLAEHLNVISKRSIEGSDIIVYVVDVSRRIGKEESRLMDIISTQNIPVIMVLNKIDLKSVYLNSYIEAWQKKADEKVGKKPSAQFIPVSAKTGKNIDELRAALLENLPQSDPFYDTDTLTDFPIQFRIADIVREKLFLALDRELPHSVAVEVSAIKDRKKVVHIEVTIYVQRNSQKKIVIGKQGRGLKAIGTLARSEIEKIYDKKVYLEIWVKVLSDWQQRPRILKELGYWWV
jgi:GTP-binding protein Era